MLLFRVTFFLSILAGAVSESENVLFVSPSGSDFAVGDRNHPFATLSFAVEKALQQQTPAPLVLLPGTYTTSANRNININVLKGSILSISGDSMPESVVIDAEGDDYIFDSFGEGSFFLSNVTLRGATGCSLRAHGSVKLKVDFVQFLENVNNNTLDFFHPPSAASRVLSAAPNPLEQVSHHFFLKSC